MLACEDTLDYYCASAAQADVFKTPTESCLFEEDTRSTESRAGNAQRARGARSEAPPRVVVGSGGGVLRAPKRMTSRGARPSGNAGKLAVMFSSPAAVATVPKSQKLGRLQAQLQVVDVASTRRFAVGRIGRKWSVDPRREHSDVSKMLL